MRRNETYSRAGFYIFLKSQFYMAIIVNYSPTFLMVLTFYCKNIFNILDPFMIIVLFQMFIAVGYVYLLPISIIQTRMGVVLIVSIPASLKIWKP